MLETDAPPYVPEAPVQRWLRRFRDLDPWAQAAVVLEAVVLIGTVAFVLAQLGPGLLTADTTPAGGDMGAHVWGPAFLRDHLLNHGRLAGWTPDWYAGFPAYQFYMVVPALMVVVLDAGVDGWGALVPLAIAVAMVVVALTRTRPIAWRAVTVGLLGATAAVPVPDERAARRERRIRRALVVGAVVVAALGCGLPYGVAFKWITVCGVLALPICCYVAGRMADLPFPGPPMLAIGSLIFLFNLQPADGGTGRIIGGNVASTLAGEFSFSISMAFLVLYLAFLLRGLRRGGYRATCAVLLALTALCHIIPAIYALVATIIALLTSWPLTKERLRWFLPIGPVALAVAAFWLGPFYLRSAYLNDMGWEKIPAGITDVHLSDFLFKFWFDGSFHDLRTQLIDTLLPSQLYWIAALALVGLVVSIVLRIRVGVLLAGCAVAMAVLFVIMPQGRLWNARLLPFFYLCLSLLAAIAVAEVGRAVAALVTRRPERAVTPVSFATPVLAGLAVVIVVGLPLGILPGATQSADGAQHWAGLTTSPDDRNIVRDWARWNYSGYERKAAYPEYHSMVAMMEDVAADPQYGCGRAMWEYENDRLNSYGTPMAPMLLPFWTDGCIGSMEGLYFEASSTTPYHFLNQRALSANCSCAQRALPYGSGFDIDLGVQQLQQMGVRYYLAFSPTAVAAAAQHPDLTEIAHDDVWHVYEVRGADMVVPLQNEPEVLTGLEKGMAWVGPASKWWQDPSRWDVLLAQDGPDDWPRAAVGRPPGQEKAVPNGSDPSWTLLDVVDHPDPVPLPAITVSNVDVGRDGVSFDVSQVGVPVLVKMSYFPNWHASGADGPYRVSPNQMVVVPTSTHVSLSYGYTGVDVGSYAVSGLGIAGAVFLAVRPRRRFGSSTDLFLDGPDPIVPPRPSDDDGDALLVEEVPDDLPPPGSRRERPLGRGDLVPGPEGSSPPDGDASATRWFTPSFAGDPATPAPGDAAALPYDDGPGAAPAAGLADIGEPAATPSPDAAAGRADRAGTKPATPPPAGDPATPPSPDTGADGPTPLD